MQFANWELLKKKKCLPCHKPLIGEPLQDLIYENGEWFHFSCLERAKKQLAEARKLARIAITINEYIASREDIGTL